MTKPISKYGVQANALNDDVSGSFGPSSFGPDSFPLSAACHNPIAPIKLSLSQLTTLRWTLAEEVVQVKQTGYDAIGLWRPKLAEFGEAHAAEILQKARLPVSSISFAGGFTGSCGFSYLEAIADGRQAIEQAQTLSADNVIMVGGSQNGHTVRHSRRLVVDAMRELGKIAASAQVKLSLLPMHRSYHRKWTFLNSLDQALDILSEIDLPNVALAFDTYHLCQESGLIERIAELAPLTGIVQLCDCQHRPDSLGDRLLPGEGTIPLSTLIQAFQLVGYSGYFDVQAWSSNVWKANYAHLIEQCHATVKEMSLRTAASTEGFSLLDHH